MSWFADYQARTSLQSVNTVNSVMAEAAKDEAADHAARQAEPQLPEPGTSARMAHDRRQDEMVRGLLKAARRPAEPQSSQICASEPGSWAA